MVNLVVELVGFDRNYRGRRRGKRIVVGIRVEIGRDAGAFFSDLSL